ncbi:VIT1/CCC1 family protein [Glutamicibacter sp. PS]|uniref:VIT1/CCC1 transporter family protein n=1 Tax=Glutamicibacter sp. PS TaxID=3075634 RepID=UPI00283DF482|nr:VIT1/CCC1 family protein [Glutamicibacter sp. PS]MDR4533820.1 VIT1/CCC1 family protein [Glutamicibacter sp. PS]
MSSDSSSAQPTPAQIRRWRRYLADEIAEGAIYRELAERRTGQERQILLGLAEAEERHEAYWRTKLGEHARHVRPSTRRMFLRWLARHFGSVFVLALAQRAESSSPYEKDADATAQMAADEQVHEEVIRALATAGRARLSGNFRAAVFGANDGLVSNLALVMGIGATGVASGFVLFSGIAGLLAGALSMAAGEYVSVRSQRELLTASRPTQVTLAAAPNLDLDANELVLIYKARGMSDEDAEHRVAERMGLFTCDCNPSFSLHPEARAEELEKEHEELGSAPGAAASSFAFFASGAVIPILPYIFGLSGTGAVVLSLVLVGLALLGTGGVVGLLSGASPLKRGLRQLGIGLGAAAVTYCLGLLFETTAV